jgi:aromatic ring-cleaving dioxygenase
MTDEARHIRITGFHAHIYFTAESRTEAEALHGLIGRHPVPMFEIDPTDHTIHALWLGRQLPLDFAKLQ